MVSLGHNELNQKGNHANWYPSSNPVIIEIIVQFSGRGLSHRQTSGITGGVQGGIWKILCCVCSWYQQSYPWVTWETIGDDHVERKPFPSSYREEGGKFISASRIRVELIRRIRYRIVVCMVQRHLVVTGCPSRYTSDLLLGPLLLTWINFNPGWISTPIIKCGMKLLIHSFWNRYVISSYTLLGMWLLIHAGIKV